MAPWDRSTPWAAKGRVAGPALLERGLELIEETLGPVDILVNNAGIALEKDALDVSIEEWSQVLSVNLDGVWNCSQIFGRGMVARGHGSIINIGSMSGLIVNRPNNQPAYNASKAAVRTRRSPAKEIDQRVVDARVLDAGGCEKKLHDPLRTKPGPSIDARPR